MKKKPWFFITYQRIEVQKLSSPKNKRAEKLS
jgi:hypothetical protein